MPKDHKKSFSKLISKMRGETGMSSVQFAAHLGINRSDLHRYEKGEREPYASFLFKMSETTGYTIIINEGGKKKLRPLSNMTTAEFHRFFQSKEDAPFTPENIKWLKQKLSTERGLYQVIFNFGRDNVLENMFNENFDIFFKLDNNA